MSFPVKILHAPLPLLFSGPPCLWQTVAGAFPSLWSCFPVRWTACSLRPSSDWHDFSRRSQAESSDRPASSGSLPVEQLVGVGEAQSAYCPCVKFSEWNQNFILKCLAILVFIFITFYFL